MRIGIDATPIFLRKGGIGYYVYHLLESLTRIDSQSEYILFKTTQSEPEAPVPFLTRANVRVVFTPQWLQKWQCRQERIDLYHGTNFRLRGRGGQGNVVTIHDLAFKHYPHFLKKKFGQSLSFLKTKWGVQRADRVIAVSDHTAGDAVEYFKVAREKIRVIYHGVGDSFRPDVPSESILAVKKKYGILTPRYILWVGTIEPRKNLLPLIQAYSRFETIHGEYSLVLGGGLGWRYQDVLNLNRSLGNQVRLTGYLPAEDLIPLYAGASLFVYPSLYEGFGMPLLEAMASGVPVIAARTSSLPEVIGDAGILVEPSSIPEIEAAIEKVLFDASLRDSLKEKGMRRAKDFTWEKAARETLKIYREIFSGRKGCS